LKLAICCNFSHPSIGGSEAVIKNISDRLVENYDYEVSVYSFSCNSSFVENGVKYIPCRKGSEFISQIAQNDHIFVYSDSFWGFDTLVRNIDKIASRLSVALVGAYHLQSHLNIFNLLKDNIDRFNLITHSPIISDYKWCVNNDLPAKVIPNGVNIDEFRNNFINFREKYNIKEKYIILNCSNWFFGKGQEILPIICKKIKSDDFIILQLSNTVQYPYDKIFFNRTKQQSKGFNIRFLRDLPREDVVSAFKCSDIFLFSSKKEVAPLVLLESQASKLPWVSMDVGNVKERSGGIVISNNNVDHKGYKIVDDKIINSYLVNIADVLELEDVRNKLIQEGQKNIDKIDWNNIVPLYHEVFNG